MVLVAKNNYSAQSKAENPTMKRLHLIEKYDNEKTIYIILESVDKCVVGDFEFEYN